MSERDLDCITDLKLGLTMSRELSSELEKYVKLSHRHVVELLTICSKYRDLIAEKDDQIAKLQKSCDFWSEGITDDTSSHHSLGK
jgi:hypothetical protein